MQKTEVFRRRALPSDVLLWLAGAVVLAAASYFWVCKMHYFRALNSFAVHAVYIGVHGIVPFAVAYRARAAGLVLALLYIPLVFGWPIVAHDIFSVDLLDPAGHYPLTAFIYILRYSIVSTIALGALGGWALRQWKV